MIHIGKVVWTFEDEQKWAAFLDSDTGKRLQSKINESSPALKGDGDLNSILIRMGEVKGVADLMSVLLNLTHSPESTHQQEISQTYPDLTDDKSWNDGQKLVPQAF